MDKQKIHAFDCNCNCAELLEITKQKSLAQLDKEIVYTSSWKGVHTTLTIISVISVVVSLILLKVFRNEGTGLAMFITGIVGFIPFLMSAIYFASKLDYLQRVKNFQLELGAAKLNE